MSADRPSIDRPASLLARVLISLLLVCAAPLLVTPARAQPTSPRPPLTAAQAAEVVDAAVRELGRYVHQDRAAKVVARLRADRAALASLADREALAAALTERTLGVSGDKHLKVRFDRYGATPAPPPFTGAGALWEDDAEEVARGRGFGAVQRLPGNVGYLRFDYMGGSAEASRVVDDAVRLVAGTDALIVDLRRNHGGGPVTLNRLLGQLSGAAPVAMTTITWRMDDGAAKVERRAADVPAGGGLYPTRPVFVLTAAETFSSAEELAYDLQVAGRAVVVGERTRGGGNPGWRVPLAHGFSMFVPRGSTAHPVTGATYDGVGVAPDVATPAAGALVEAYRRALAAPSPLPAVEEERVKAVADPAAALAAAFGG